MTSGGWRAGAGRPPGRPKGSKDKLPRRRRIRFPTLQQIEDAKERALAFLRENEARIVEELLNCGDPRIVFETWKLLKSYSDGAPPQRLEVSHRGPTPAEILEVIARERALRAQALLPAPIETTAKAKG